MACVCPVRAWQSDSGAIVFAEVRSKGSIRRPLLLSCGQCIGCRLERSRQWAVRCVNEASLYDASSFVTLTYSDANLPVRGMLRYRDFQLFVKRLRKRVGEVRYVMCGEYGELNSRPHYHACLFGVWFEDREKIRLLGSENVYRSATLDKCWQLGGASFGAVTFESAAYVARYCVKKVTGPAAQDYYHRVDEFGEYDLPPEFLRCSLKPGIGARWLSRFEADVYPSGNVVSRGTSARAPRYYDKLFEASGGNLDFVKFDREVRALECASEATPERRAVRAQVLLGGLQVRRKV